MTSENKYYKSIDLLKNGKLFPTWVMANFKEYKLPPLVVQKDDPCKETMKEVKKELMLYQKFLSKYLNPQSQFTNILLYHAMGTGKTMTTLNIFNTLLNADMNYNMVLLIKASLHDDPWLDSMKNWFSANDMKNIHFVHYDSPISGKKYDEVMQKIDVEANIVFIIEEAHNFIRNVSSSMANEKPDKNALHIYRQILRHRNDNDTTRVICLSGTPAINEPFELGLLFNLLRNDVFPNTKQRFDRHFMYSDKNPVLMESRKNQFQRRILGLVSYYGGKDEGYFAKQKQYNIEVEMNKYHESIYLKYHEQEEEVRKRLSMRKKQSKTYRTYTRQACNFVFPEITNNMKGETRPRPNEFRLSEKEIEKMDKQEVSSEQKNKAKQYFDAINEYIKGFKNYLDKHKDNKLNNDIDGLGKGLYKDYKTNIKSGLTKELERCSSKMLNIIFNIAKSEGPVIVYSNYVRVEGIEVLKIYLEYMGYTEYNKDCKGNCYVEYTGSTQDNMKKEIREVFRGNNNVNGGKIKIILLSPAGTEGLDFLRNIRQVHILEPYWNEVRILQLIGRAIRRCSHSDLPFDKRLVEVYRYYSTTKKVESTDIYIKSIAEKKQKSINSFLQAMKEAAVDCELNKEHNMTDEQYTCFKFNEESLFDAMIGPAYVNDILDDMELNDGTNNENSSKIKIVVYEIEAVKLLGEEKYSEKKIYLYNPNTGVVYDIELHYAVGMVSMDKGGMPNKLDAVVYIIDKVIPIPYI